MKRRTSLVLVGLSLTTASLAFAAPSSAARPVRVAQAAPAPSSSSPFPADPSAPLADPSAPAPSSTTTPSTTPPPEAPPSTPADPATPATAPAPSDTTAPAVTPAPSTPAPSTAAPAPASADVPPASTGSSLSIGLGTNGNPPGADTPQASAPAPEAAPKPRPWAGTSVFLMNDVGTYSIFRGQQQYDNPTVSSSIYFLPRYTISDTFQFRGRMIFSYEYTNSDDTVSRNEPRFTDATGYLYYKKIPKVVGFKPLLAASLAVPTSPESRARTMLFTPGAILQVSQVFEKILGSDLLILSTLSYSHPIYQSQTPELRGALPYNPACIGGGTSCVGQLSGTYNASDILSYALMIAPTWGNWAPAVYYVGSSQWTYQGKQNVTTPDGNAVTTPAGFNPQHFRQSSYFSAWLDYQFNSWLTGEVGYYMSRNVLTANGKYGNPFFDRYQDTRVYLGANVVIDSLIEEIMGAGEGKAGIPRAQNTRKPMWSF